ncbi:hypothetical protein Poli38472_001738 [Pythium oligandrum]|uniref:RNA methyltransferase n=1 Tax=Pythium oligandrum TaxID=41045 RepID=A0A8K1CVC5_PYTOL|nr:hypothetical protein Poli38472_001738 [Pythium oligandrum]|eukprot:TMW69582.1 hypothetical protein Poli38472_001738 [Pythium oligandrum]
MAKMATDKKRGDLTRHSENGQARPHNDVPNKKRRINRKLPKEHRVGNFRSYYNYRLGQAQAGALEDDPRLSVLQQEWFQGKRGIDVGCNSGDVTIAIAKRFAPSYIMGVDVDPQLISRARGQLRDLVQKQQVEDAFRAIAADPSADSQDKSSATDSTKDTEAKLLPKDGSAEEAAATNVFTDEMPLSFRLWKPPQQPKHHTPQDLGKASRGDEFPFNVVFKREDIVNDKHVGTGYDFITCFSVTKWIHLLNGDEGIQKAFRLFYDLLAPGGRLILEPQPWKSYHKRKFTSETTEVNYSKIQLRPKEFPTFLVETVGFKSCTFLQVCQTSAKGFKRPIYLVEK